MKEQLEIVDLKGNKIGIMNVSKLVAKSSLEIIKKHS